MICFKLQKWSKGGEGNLNPPTLCHFWASNYFQAAVQESLRYRKDLERKRIYHLTMAHKKISSDFFECQSQVSFCHTDSVSNVKFPSFIYSWPINAPARCGGTILMFTTGLTRYFMPILRNLLVHWGTFTLSVPLDRDLVLPVTPAQTLRTFPGSKHGH